MKSTDLIVALPYPDIDLDMLEYAVWNSTPLDAYQDNEEVFIRWRGDVAKRVHRAFYNIDECQFYVGDGSVHVSKCEHRKIFPESTLERAAVNYLHTLTEKAQ